MFMHTQMVGLYQDPDGKMIFSATNPTQLHKHRLSTQSSFKWQVKNDLEVLIIVHIGVTLLVIQSCN